MVSRAALNFASLYSLKEAQKIWNIDEHSHVNLKDSAELSTLEQYANDAGTYASAFNKGMMSQMQQNPDDTTADCYEKTLLTNAEIMIMVDFSAYYSETFDIAGFTELFKVMQIALVQELESCNYMQFLISLDGFLSNIPAAVAGASNLATQLGLGFGNGNKDTSAFLAYDKFVEGRSADNDFEIYGQAFQLFLSQLLKVSADGEIEVSPTSA